MSGDESEVGTLRAAALPQRIEALARIASRGRATMAEITAVTECLGASEKLMQRRAAETLASLELSHDAIRPVLLSMLRDNDGRCRWGAAYALALMGPPPAETLPVLLESLGANDGDLRWAAVDILLRVREWKSAAVDLCELIAAGNAAQRKMAAYALRALKHSEPQVQSALTAALSDPDAGVRMAAVSALLHLAADPDAATEAASRLLHDADPGIRRATAALLGQLGTPRKGVLDALRAASTSDDESLRRAATRSLERLERGAR